MTNQAANPISPTRRAPPKPTKKLALQLHHEQQQRANEPWLFQSISALSPLVTAPLSSSSPAQASPHFYLDVESLRTLLPVTGRRHRPRSSSNGNGEDQQRYPRHAPARLDALVVPSPTRRHRSKKHRAKSARPTSVHRKLALRIDAVKARQQSNNAINTTQAASINDTAPVAPSEDLDEARRQKTAIAAQLGLTLDEYEALDSAFGGEDTDSSQLTARYQAVFAQFDVDGSGSISPSELRQLLSAAGEDMDDAEVAQVIAQADTDGDGEIDLDEFLALMRARKRLLRVATTMGPANSSSPASLSVGSVGPSSSASPLPPLKLVVAQSKRHLRQSPAPNHAANLYNRPTPSCLRPGASVDVTQLRRELALAEFGIQQLNDKVRDGVAWVQQHCPVNSLRAQLFCHRWGMEKVHALFQRLQSQALSRAYQKWKAFLLYERNKVKANLFLKCKGSQKVASILAKWTRKTLRRRWAKWHSESAADARNEALASIVEIQRVWRGALARRLRHRLVRNNAAIAIQKVVRGRLARCLVARIRRQRLEHHSACVLQRCYRGYNGKRLAKALFQAQRDALAARTIQRAFRKHQHARLLQTIQLAKRDHDAAVRIQCIVRGRRARKERQRRSNMRRRDKASIVVQRYTRGWLARRETKRQRRAIAAATTIQRRYRAYRSHWQWLARRREQEERRRFERETRAATTIQKYWRRAHCRRQYVHLRMTRREAQALLGFQKLTGAVRIQRLFRGYRARREAQKRRFDRLKWLNFTAMNASALRIQAAWRGYHGRLASQLRRQAQRALEAEEHRAAIQIQRLSRGKLARGELNRRTQRRQQQASSQQRQTKAALQIQRVFRGKQARRRAAKLQAEHQRQARAALDRLVQQTRTRAALRIQCCVRRYLSKNRYLAKKKLAAQRQREHAIQLERDHAAVVIQCALRRAKARRLLVQRRRELEKRLSLMASEKAQDEIERLREEQEQELARLRVQLMLQESQATAQAAKLREELEKQREAELERRDVEAQELAKLKLEALMQQHAQASERKLVKQQESDKLRESLERQRKETQEKEEMMRTQENKELARLKMTALLRTSTASIPEQDVVEQARLQRAAVAMQREQAQLRIQGVCLKYLAKRRLVKLQASQAAALAQLHSEEERLRVRALQEKEMALAKLKAMMDDEARAREQELKAMEAQMLERARLEKERIAGRVAAARNIQARVRGFLGRQRVRAIQRKIEREREERGRAMEEQLAAAEAKMVEVMSSGGGAASSPSDGEGGEGGGEGGAVGNPEDWVEYWDENAQASYFYNIKTQEASWTRPFSAPAAAEVVELLGGGGAGGAAQDYDAAGYAEGYGGDAGAAAGYGAEGYADEYGFYDQYGQYHYYDDGSNGTTAASTAAAYPANNMAAMAAGMMYPGYAAYAAAAAYQAAMTFGGNPMMFGAGAMPYGQQMMMPGNPMMMAAMGTQPQAQAAVVSTSEGDATAPPDPWEKFFDQYSGAAYYYNSITGEKYWA